ncbi:MAG: zinc finger-like domain-containing protein, partial [Planctomycetota bacterium]
MRWILLPCLAFICLISPLWAQDEEFKKRRTALKPEDHEGLFQLGMWCLSLGGPLEKRARECFEDLLHTPGDVRDRAAFRLALWHLNRGRGYADHRLGIDLLASLAGRGAKVPASRELEGRKPIFAVKKREMVEGAMRALVAGKVIGASKTLAQARRLPFGRASGEPDLGDEALFGNIARALADSEREAKRFADPNLSIACPKCAGSGFAPCKTCEGKGKVRKKTPPRRELTKDGLRYVPGKWVTVKCGKCAGGGKLACTTCRATGMDFKLCDEEMRQTFLRFGTWLKNLSASKEPNKAVRRAFEETIEARLRAPAALKASLSFPLIPPTREKMDLASLKTHWETASVKDKYKLIRGISILSARWLEPFFFHSESRRTLGVKEPFREKTLTVPLPPEVVGADPFAFRNRWVRVVGKS